MLRLDIYRRPFGGSAAGHARSYGAEDPGVHGPAARICHRAPHRAGFRRPSAFEPGHALSRAAAPATAGLDHGPLGTSENNRRARFYGITRAGCKQLAAEAADWERMAAIISRLLQTPQGA